jgi:hypothetical protein
MNNKLTRYVATLTFLLTLVFAHNARAEEGFVPEVGGKNSGSLGVLPPNVFERPFQKQAFANDAGQDLFDVQVFVIRGPIVWGAWGTNAIWSIYQNRSAVNDVGRVFKPLDIMQGPGGNDVLWFATRITRKTDRKLNLGMLYTRQFSSDERNILSNSYSTRGMNFNYTEVAFGVIWGPNGKDGPRSEQTIRIGTSGNEDVDEIIFLNAHTAFFPFSTDAQRYQNEDYIFFEDLNIVVWIEVVGANGENLGRGTRNLYSTLRPVIHIEAATDSNTRVVVMRFEVPDGRTADLWASPFLGAKATWTKVGQVKDGQKLVRPVISPSIFYKTHLPRSFQQ